MIGMVLVTHGELGETLRAAMEHVVGPQKQVATLRIGADAQILQCRRALAEEIGRVDTGDGVMLLTDMFGSTPSNLAIAAMERGGVEVIAGVNLPMLVKLAKIRSQRTPRSSSLPPSSMVRWSRSVARVRPWRPVRSWG